LGFLSSEPGLLNSFWGTRPFIETVTLVSTTSKKSVFLQLLTGMAQ